MPLLPIANFLSKKNFAKKSFTNTIRLSNGLDPDQDRRSVGSDLGPNYLLSLSAGDKVARLAMKESKVCFVVVGVHNLEYDTYLSGCSEI